MPNCWLMQPTPDGHSSVQRDNFYIYPQPNSSFNADATTGHASAFSWPVAVPSALRARRRLTRALGITKYSIVTNSNDSVTLRLMTEHDLAMLYEWLNRSHIVEWWGGEKGRPIACDVQEQYLPSVLAQESVTPYIAMLNGEPIGYAQWYVALGSGDLWWEEEEPIQEYAGIDQSLANASQLGKEVGNEAGTSSG